MIHLKFSGAAYEKGRIRIGVRIEGPEQSWIRFGVLEVPIHDLGPEIIRQLLLARSEMSDLTPQDVGLFE